MYDQVTLKLNVDPWSLSALKEDITSEDVSTNSVMPHPQAGEVILSAKKMALYAGYRYSRECLHFSMKRQQLNFWCRMEQKFIRYSLWQKCMAISGPFYAESVPH